MCKYSPLAWFQRTHYLGYYKKLKNFARMPYKSYKRIETADFTRFTGIPLLVAKIVTYAPNQTHFHIRSPNTTMGEIQVPHFLTGWNRRCGLQRINHRSCTWRSLACLMSTPPLHIAICATDWMGVPNFQNYFLPLVLDSWQAERKVCMS